jgi:hypothetical protein
VNIKLKLFYCVLLCLIMSVFSESYAGVKLLYPFDNQTGVALTPNFLWNKSSNNATGYIIQIDSNFSFSTILKSSSVTDTTYSCTTNTLKSRKYYWRVSSDNGSSWSIDSFTTAYIKICLLGTFDDDGYLRSYRGDRQDSTDTLIHYAAKLGYNYVLMNLNYHYDSLRINSNGTWSFGNIDSINAVTKIKKAKQEIEKWGMWAVPQIELFSHMQNVIHYSKISGTKTIWYTRNSLSEFSSDAACSTYMRTNGLIKKGSTLESSTIREANSVSSDNDSLREYFRAILRIVKSAWGDSQPQYICMGHDEIGYQDTNYNFVCLVGAGKSKDSVSNHGGGGIGKSYVIAKEMKNRCLDVDTVFKSKIVKKIFWGDCFVPGHNGESAKLIGDTNGVGSVLQILKDTMILSKNAPYKFIKDCIIMPWEYWEKNGEKMSEGNSTITIDYNKEYLFINMFGFKFINCFGEAFNYKTQWCGLQDVYRHIQVAYEQIRGTQFAQDNFYGLGDLLFSKWDTIAAASGQNDTCGGYTLPIVAYFGWAFGDTSLIYARHHPFSGQVNANLNPIRSRKNYSWTLGTVDSVKDYKKPIIGSFLSGLINW